MNNAITPATITGFCSERLPGALISTGWHQLHAHETAAENKLRKSTIDCTKVH